MRRAAPRAYALALAALTACATAGEAAAPSSPSFHGVRSLVLVRSQETRGERPRDALDGLEETLRSRGFSVRSVDLGRKPPAELEPVERLFELLEMRATSVAPDRPGSSAGPVSREAGALVARIGVDAVASYHRLERRRSPELPSDALAGSMFPPPSAPPERPVGVFMLADREGHVAAFAWGGSGSLDDTAPLNAAEAIEVLIRALGGDSSGE